MGESLKIGKTAATAAKARASWRPPRSARRCLRLREFVPRFGPPSPVAIVPEPQATNAIKLDASTLAKLDRLVASYVVAIASLDVNDPKFESRVADIRTLGDEDIKASAQVSSRLLDRPVGFHREGRTCHPGHRRE